jgi:pimeloyl-ACP methyl ester carboxylesterase
MGDPSENARPGNAEDGKTTPLSPGPRTIPIIIVPGIMGSRLSDTQDNLVWNPTGTPLGRDAGLLAADVGKLSDVKRRLVPDTTNVFNSFNEIFHKRRAAPIVNFYHLIGDFYRDICFAMSEKLPTVLKAAGKNVSTRVYGSGYDWRQDNAESSLLLGKVVAQAQKDCDGEQVILIAHSMGGLVSRYYCKSGGEKNVRALFLLGSPTLGAPKAYGLLKQGMPAAPHVGVVDTLLRLLLLESFTERDSRDLLRRLPSTYQLAPTSLYGRKVDGRWLSFDPAETGFPEKWTSPGNPKPDPVAQFDDCTVSSSEIYLDLYTGFMNVLRERTANEANVFLARAFHNFLTEPNRTTYMPPHTFSIFTNDKDTVIGAGVELVEVAMVRSTVFLHLKEMTVTKAHRGDGTVPAGSADPPVNSPFEGTLVCSNVEHGAIPADPKVIRYIMDKIVTLV